VQLRSCLSVRGLKELEIVTQSGGGCCLTVQASFPRQPKSMPMWDDRGTDTWPPLPSDGATSAARHFRSQLARGMSLGTGVVEGEVFISPKLRFKLIT